MSENKSKLQISQLKDFYFKKRRMPSYAELAALMKFKSKNAAQYLVKKWIEAGVVAKDASGKLLPGKPFFPVKVLGEIKAGWPSPAEEENVDTVSLDDWLIQNKEATFMLKVSGDSMIDAGIHPGDMVIINRGKQPKNGDIVIAEIDSEWTLKYFVKSGSQVLLRPANRKYATIKPKQELRIAGVVTSVIRKYS
ncbi:repressor LexA [Candidatus Peregrinibacteria bacterium]|nr:repressor LexA [Candidatus Peregrinibacteria bacterium]